MIEFLYGLIDAAYSIRDYINRHSIMKIYITLGLYFVKIILVILTSSSIIFYKSDWTHWANFIIILSICLTGRLTFLL